MLSARIARMAAREGLSLVTALDSAWLGLVGSIRVVPPIGVAVSDRVAAQLREIPELRGRTLADILNAGDAWLELFVRPATPGASPADGSDPMRLLARHVMPEPARWKVRLTVHASELSIGLAVQDEATFIAAGILQRRPGGTLLLGKFADGASRARPLDVLAVLASSVLLRTNHKRISAQARREHAFLRAHRNFVGNVRAHALQTTPTRSYYLVQRSPVAIETDGTWPRAFRLPRTQLTLPTKRGGTFIAEILAVDDAAETIVLDRDDREGNLLPSGDVSVRPAVQALDRVLATLRTLEEGEHPAHLALLEALQRPGALPPLEPEKVPMKRIGQRNAENARQHEAVEMGLGCRDICTIHGPPGTGKTTVICELILQLTARQERVLLVAPTHVALDHVLEQIGEAPGVVALRLGSADNVDERTRKYTVRERAASLSRDLQARLDEAVAGVPDADRVARVQRAWRAGIDDAGETVGRLLLLNANLVCATPIGIAMTPEFRDASPVFDVMIMDESSKATMTDFLVPAARARRWILVGDDRQLPPYADQDDLVATIEMRGNNALEGKLPSGWATDVAAALRRHFDQRMHPSAAIRERRWTHFVETALVDERLHPLSSTPCDERQWRDLAKRLEDGSVETPPVSEIPEELRPRAAARARLVAELIELQRVSMPSIFEELTQLRADRAVRLNHQHRMHPELAEFSRTAVYGGDYLSASATRELGLVVPDFEVPSVWIDTSRAPRGWNREHSAADDGEGAYYNPFEVHVVESVLDTLVAWARSEWRRTDPRGKPIPFEIGVISFYVEQAVRIADRLFADLPESEGRWRRRASVAAANGAPIELHVSVVDRFQGREKDVVVLSATRSNDERRRGHVDNLNRLNVALTRARHKRIIIGDQRTLVRKAEDDLLRRLFESCTVKYSYGPAWTTKA